MGKSASDNRRRLFAALYMGQCRMNGSAAAKGAGYTGTKDALAVTASRLLDDPEVRALINDKLGQAETDQQEVLGVLVGQMRTDMNDFIRFDESNDPHLDLGRAREASQLRKIKSFKERRRKQFDPKTGAEVGETVTYEIQLHDAQSAAVHVGKAMGMFVDRLKIEEAPKPVQSHAERMRAYASFCIPVEKWSPHLQAILTSWREGRKLNQPPPPDFAELDKLVRETCEGWVKKSTGAPPPPYSAAAVSNNGNRGALRQS